jgi:hypothetical protein
VHLERVFVAVAPGVEVEVQVVAGELAVDQLHAADLDDAVAAFGRQAGGFGVQNDLPRIMVAPRDISGFPWRG